MAATGAGDLQARAEAVVDELVSSGAETGLQVAVVRNGGLIADVAGGAADPGTGRPVTPDTLFWAVSTAKGVAATVAHVLAERGVLDYGLRLAEVWPEFAAHGKEHVTLRHVLCHTAGVPGLPPGTTVADLCDWDHMCAVLAGARPWWEPGTRFGYHAKTFGFLVGETLRRVTGRRISALLREHVTGPLVVLTTGCSTWNEGLDIAAEGSAVPVTDDARLTRLAQAWSAKWDGRWHYQVQDGRFRHPGGGDALVYSVTPRKCSPSARGTSPTPRTDSDRPGRRTGIQPSALPVSQALRTSRALRRWP